MPLKYYLIYNYMMNSLFSIIGLLFAAILILYYYRSVFVFVKNDPKGSIIMAISVIFMMILFYFFFKGKGF
jgi:hypothetical protein